MNDPYADAAKVENDYSTQAGHLGASKEYADRVLRQAIHDVSRSESIDPYELARLQLAANLHQNPQ